MAISETKSTEGSSGLKYQASISLGPPHHVTIIEHIIYGNKHKIHIHKHESEHSEMGPVRQNPIQGPVRLFKKLCNYIMLHNTT